MKLPKSLLEKRDKGMLNYKKAATQAGFHSGFNAGAQAVLESEELKGLIDTAKKVLKLEEEHDSIWIHWECCHNGSASYIAEEALTKWKEFIEEELEVKV